MRLSALAYYGGKSAWRNTGRWVSETIGATPEGWAYCEPFAGMLGVLLQRPPARYEIVNDSSKWVIAWWAAVRDHPQEFARIVDATPWSRAEFARAVEIVQGQPSGDVLRDAHAAHIVITQGITHGTRATPGEWASRYAGPGAPASAKREPIQALGARIRAVQLECRDALEILERTAKRARILIYCDPPYPTTATKPYENVPDVDALADVLRAQKGRVAISGTGAEWDCLGWRRVQLETSTGFANHTRGESAKRTEVIWLNYEAPGGGFFD